MSTITIIEGNNNDKDNTRALMVKGETGATISTIAKTSTSGLTDTYTVTLSDGRTQTFTVTNGKSITTIEKTGTSGLVDTYTITFNDNTTHTFTVTNGYSPTATVSKTNGVTTVTITDKEGTTTAEINDAVGYEVPAGAVIGWNNNNLMYVCDGTETGTYYLVNNNISYYFTMPNVSDGDKLIFDTTELELTYNGSVITTASSGTGTALTFIDYIPDGYEETQETFGGGGETLKVGTILEYTGTTAPDGYMFCDGSAISRITYSQLFAVIGTSYGAGDGSTTFNIPNFKGRVGVGYDSTQSEFDTLGETGGEKTHTLTVNEMPSHSHQADYSQSGGVNIGVTAMGTKMGTSTLLKSTGGDQAHNNLQPYIVINYIIKVAQTTPTSAQIVDGYSTSTTDGYSANYVNNLHTYSTTEQRVGTWIDGKPIYRKVVDCGALPNATTKTVNHNIANIDMIASYTIIAKNPTANTYITVPYTNKTNVSYQIDSFITDTIISITSGDNKSAYTQTYTTIEYTKTTD